MVRTQKAELLFYFVEKDSGYIEGTGHDSVNTRIDQGDIESVQRLAGNGCHEAVERSI